MDIPTFLDYARDITTAKTAAVDVLEAARECLAKLKEEAETGGGIEWYANRNMTKITDAITLLTE